MLIKYEGTGGDIIVPDDVVTIGSGVFFNRNDIMNMLYKSNIYKRENSVFIGLIFCEFGKNVFGKNAFSTCRTVNFFPFVKICIATIGECIFRCV